MRSSIILSILVTLAFAVSEESLATSCHPQNYENHLKYSEWVFIGSVLEASIVSGKNHLIEFTLSDIDKLRGSPPDQVQLTTNQGAYDPKITIGRRYIVYVNSGDPYVGFCTGFSNVDSTQSFVATLHRNRGLCGTVEDRHRGLFYLQEEYLSHDTPPTMEQMREFLSRFKVRFPDLRIFHGDSVISLKGFDFLFEDGVLEAIELGECDA